MIFRRARVVGLILGAGLFGWAVAAVGWPSIWQELRRFSWRMVPILAFYLVIFGLDTWGWRYAFSRQHQTAPWRSLFLARMAGEAVNYVTPLAWVGGEPVKAYLLAKRHGVPMTAGVSSVVIAKTTLTVGLLLFALCGIGLAIGHSPLSSTILRLSWGVLGGLGIVIGGFMLSQRWGLFRRLGPLVRRMVGPQLAPTGAQGHEIDEAIRRFYRCERGRLALSVGFHFLGWVAGVVEVWLILRFLGIPVTIVQAWIIESLWQLLKAGAFLIPAGVGAQEGGAILICVGLGFSIPSGLAMAIVRRIRELFWTAIGLLVWSRYEAVPVTVPG